MAALVKAATELMIEPGADLSIRNIAGRARVNHGLVHTYFGSKQALLAEAAHELLARVPIWDGRGSFPRIARADADLARLLRAFGLSALRADHESLFDYPHALAWSQGIVAAHPGMSDEEAMRRVLIGFATGLGWTLFARQLASVLGLDHEQLRRAEAELSDMVESLDRRPTSDVPTALAEGAAAAAD